MRKILLSLAILAGLASQASAADNYAATAGSGLTFAAKDATGVLYSRFIGCDNTIVSQCWAVDASGRLTALAVQSGTWTVQPGNTANTTPWLMTVAQGGNSAIVKAGNTFAGTEQALGVAVTNTLTAVTPGDGITTTIYGTAPASPVIGVPLLWNGTTYDRQKSAGATGVAAVRQSDGTNVAQIDPCQSEVKTTLPITLATAAVKVIAVGVSAKKVYVCQIHLTNNAADSVAVFEATTATTCATSPVAVVGAGTSVATAATGYNFAANGGISLGTGSNQVLQTATNANDLCIAQSSATQLTGSITYVTR